MAGLTTTTRRRRATEVEEPVRHEPPPAHAVLALQRQAGNHAVTRMVQRLTLTKHLDSKDRVQGGDVDRPVVAMQLAELPLEVRNQLLDEIGAQTIRNVVTARFLLILLRALKNDAARVIKLLGHLDELDLHFLREIEQEYTDPYVATLLDAPPMIVQRRVRALKRPGAREPGMVVIATDAVDPNDFVIHSHINYALSQVGGPAHLIGEANLSVLDPSGTLYIVEHGSEGGIGPFMDDDEEGSVPVDVFVNHLVHPQAGLPEDFHGKIKITSCYSAIGSEENASVVERVKAGLRNAGRQGIEVIGAMGPSITNAKISSKYAVIDPKRIDDATYAQAFLLGQLPEFELERSDELERKLGLGDHGAYEHGKHAAMAGAWAQRGQVEDPFAFAAQLSKPFYEDLLAIAQRNGMLLAGDERKGR
jgi:hypothetical protein